MDIGFSWISHLFQPIFRICGRIFYSSVSEGFQLDGRQVGRPTQTCQVLLQPWPVTGITVEWSSHQWSYIWHPYKGVYRYSIIVMDNDALWLSILTGSKTIFSDNRDNIFMMHNNILKKYVQINSHFKPEIDINFDEIA